MKAALIRRLRLSAARWPRTAFLLTAPIAWLSYPFGRGIATERLADVFPDLPRRRLRAASRRTWSNYLQVEVLAERASRSGPRHEPLKLELVPNPRLAELQPPLILGLFHAGLLPALGPLIRRLPGEVLVVHRGGLAPRPGVKLLRRGENEWERARTFHQSVRTLRSGGFVVTAMDGGYRGGGYDAATLEAPMLGTTISLARGPFALARITHTAIVPLAARQAGRRIAISTGDPIAPDVGEQAMAAAAAGWLEGYLREFPGEISLRTLEILGLPPTTR